MGNITQLICHNLVSADLFGVGYSKVVSFEHYGHFVENVITAR